MWHDFRICSRLIAPRTPCRWKLIAVVLRDIKLPTNSRNQRSSIMVGPLSRTFAMLMQQICCRRWTTRVSASSEDIDIKLVLLLYISFVTQIPSLTNKFLSLSIICLWNKRHCFKSKGQSPEMSNCDKKKNKWVYLIGRMRSIKLYFKRCIISRDILNYAQRNANKNTHIAPVNSSAEFFRAIRTKIERSHGSRNRERMGERSIRGR